MMTIEDFASKEEWLFYHWLLEAEENNLAKMLKYQPGSLILSNKIEIQFDKKLKTKTKQIKKTLFQEHIYTPDFLIQVDSDTLLPVFKNTSYLKRKTFLIDTKGNFDKYGASKFSVNQKWVWQKYNGYIEKVVPDKLFKKTWVPEIARYSPVRKQLVKKYIGMKTISEFIKGE